jgi:hypothetical protein
MGSPTRDVFDGCKLKPLLPRLIHQATAEEDASFVLASLIRREAADEELSRNFTTGRH